MSKFRICAGLTKMFPMKCVAYLGFFSVTPYHSFKSLYLQCTLHLCTTVNLIIYQAAARTNLKRVSLELGGKSPLVIFDDVEDLGNTPPLLYLMMWKI